MTPDDIEPIYQGPAPVDAWFLMGGEIRWSEVVIVADFLGESDIFLLVHGLIEVREFFRRREAARQRAAEVEAEIKRAGI